MKNIFLSLTLLGLTFMSISQEMSKKLEKAEKDYNGFSYNKAIEQYTESNDSSLTSRRNLAISYSKLGKTEAAEILYQSIVNNAGKLPEDLYNYAEVLRQNKKYDQSEVWMNNYHKLEENDSRAKAYVNNPQAYKQLLEDKDQFKISNLEINSPQEDFSPVYYGDKVLFTSSREGVKSIRRIWNWNQLPFLDIYEANIYEGDELSMATQFSKRLNKKFHEGPVCFNTDLTKLVLTRNNYESKSSDGLIKLQLYASRLVGDKWSIPEPFPYNSAEYSVGHAAFSPDGNWLYFASDMPGGIGGVDLYKVEITKEGYGKPINLGSSINTEGNELFPTVHSEGILFFASNGLVGLGGLDIFAAQLKENDEIGQVKNLGTPVNTNRDDFSLVLHKDGKKGYFASNREDGKGDDDIYRFDLIKPITFGKRLKGLIINPEGDPIDFVKLELLNHELEKLKEIESDSLGEFEFLIPDDVNFFLLGEKDKFLGFNREITRSEDKDVVFVEVVMEKDPGLSLYALITDKKTGLPIDSVLLTVSDNLTDSIDQYITTEKGDFFKPLNEKKLNDRGSYNITLEKKGYLSKTVTYNTVFDKEGRYEVHAKLDLSLKPIEIGGDLSKVIDINPIYFDLGKSKIRPDAALELDKIVKVMNENPKMVIELGSHTDSRGSNASNLSLSDRRAKASAAYVQERITNPDRINGKGYGESKPNTVDASADGGQKEQVLIEDFINPLKSKNRKLYEKYHQFNRRTEFLIIKM